jgi:hypothetical protein
VISSVIVAVDLAVVEDHPIQTGEMYHPYFHHLIQRNQKNHYYWKNS